ncbi:hypothetical protein IJJ27_00670 [bacterium]|nr:hypothetical protein [bacterium]MBQ6436062.1 hypothetical protein [bacterium]
MAKAKIVIKPTLDPQAQQKKRQVPILRPYYRPFFYVAVPASLLTLFFVIFFYRYLPPVVPLYGSLTQTVDRLAEKKELFILPAMALTINFVHALVIYFGRHYDLLILQMFSYLTIFVQVLILAVLLRTILVVI